MKAYPLDPCGVGGDDAVRVPPLLCVCVAGAIARAARGGGGAGQHPSPGHKLPPAEEHLLLVRLPRRPHPQVKHRRRSYSSLESDSESQSDCQEAQA
ncbi:hypothetical protein ZWY2020_013850 [Hordeum vulgare]|nr:hypothetical protein ZWY2020_013850 [Hordeum vulgare]